MKYIMLKAEQPAITRYIPIIFPSVLVHADVAQAMRRCLLRMGCFTSVEPSSAGEYDTATEQCHGKSTTLGLASRPEDGRIIATFDYTHGII